MTRAELIDLRLAEARAKLRRRCTAENILEVQKWEKTAAMFMEQQAEEAEREKERLALQRREEDRAERRDQAQHAMMMDA